MFVLKPDAKRWCCQAKRIQWPCLMCLTHTDVQSSPSRTGSNWLLFSVYMYYLIPPPTPSLSQADAMEFSGHDGFALPSQGSNQSCWEGSRPGWQWYNTCVPSLQMDSHQHLTVVQFQWREWRWHISPAARVGIACVLVIYFFLLILALFVLRGWQPYSSLCKKKKNPMYHLCLPYCNLGILVASLAVQWNWCFIKKLKIAVFALRCICIVLQVKAGQFLLYCAV